MVAQWLQQVEQRIARRLRVRRASAHADQAGELFGRQAQLVLLDPEEVADALEVVGSRAALAAEVLVELGAVDAQLAADLGDRAVVAAEQLEVVTEMLGHGAAPVARVTRL
ncbi:hypothetical protein D3C72_1688860 [compost metagenome]